MSQVHELREPDLAGLGLRSSNKGREVPVTGILGFQEGHPDTKKRLMLEGQLSPSPFDPCLHLFFGFCLVCLAIGSWHLWLLFLIPSHLRALLCSEIWLLLALALQPGRWNNRLLSLPSSFSTM